MSGRQLWSAPAGMADGVPLAPAPAPAVKPFDFASWRKLTVKAIEEAERQVEEKHTEIAQAQEVIKLRRQEVRTLRDVLAYADRRFGAVERHTPTASASAPGGRAPLVPQLMDWFREHGGELRVVEFARGAGRSVTGTRNALDGLVMKGQVARVEPGRYRLAANAQDGTP